MVIPAALALLGYARSLAGVTRAQRAVWVKARIVAVEQPAHGGSRKPGIPVTLTFQDPGTGREFTLSNAGKHGEAIEEAWVGREVEVRYPPGQPLRFAVVLGGAGEQTGREGPDCAVMLLLIGLVIHATVRWGWPWALLGFGTLLTAAAVRSPDIRMVRARNAQLASAVAVPARVVAVTRDVYTDDESGGDIVVHAPSSPSPPTRAPTSPPCPARASPIRAGPSTAPSPSTTPPPTRPSTPPTPRPTAVRER
ncbi:DUF3592 domain-containing protein [Streptomyces milbemycinicus]|uniref:DUF3592 domain-containing protein n=1 Tax=Streptomyces milbemycinicus TaxID=476552 RepID=UPI0029CA4585|nr:DUF3592 domain-containing protein [Streptomyces milbemycinicus]